MVFRKSELDGYVRIDHRDSPGFTEQEAIAGGRSIMIGAPKLIEAATFCCSHCDRIVIRNPFRVRERAHCISCDRDICDSCGVEYKLTSECRCRSKRIAQFMAQAISPTLRGT